MSGGLLAVVAFLIAAGNWAVYWPKIKAMRVPLRPVGHQAVMGGAIVLALIAFMRGPGLLGGGAAVLALLAAGMFLFFTLNSAMPPNTPAVAVGETILDFTAKDSAGADFALASLKGAPFLLKFFRGHW